MDEFERIQFALFYHYDWLQEWDLSPSEQNMRDALADWEKQKARLNMEPWVNGKHAGDCTDVPMACHRCWKEMYEKQAKFLMELTENKNDNIEYLSGGYKKACQCIFSEQEKEEIGNVQHDNVGIPYCPKCGNEWNRFYD